jgi:hypothetical protein
MLVEQSLYFLLQSYLNPALFLLYLIFQQLFISLGIETFTSSGINNQRLVIGWYLLLMPLIYLIWFTINLFFLKSFNAGLSLNSFVNLDIHWLQYLSIFVTVVTLKAYSSKTGVEGNILGFIFAPMLLMGMLINGLFYFMWIWQVVLKGAAA